MTHIEKLHLEAIKQFEHHCTPLKDFASKSAEITEQIAIGFAEFIEGVYSFGNIAGKWYLHMNTDKEYTAKELFQQYLKTK